MSPLRHKLWQKIRPFPEEIIAVGFWTWLATGLASLLTTPFAAELAPMGAANDARTILVAAAGAFLRLGVPRLESRTGGHGCGGAWYAC